MDFLSKDLEFEFGIDIQKQISGIEYNLGTKIFNELPKEASVYIEENFDPKKLSIRLKRLSQKSGLELNGIFIYDKFSIIREGVGYRVFRF